MRITCILASAGKGRRLNERREKPFLTLSGKPLLLHTLKAIEGISFIKHVIVVVSHAKLKATEKLVAEYALRKIRAVIPGGKRRFDSVKNGLAKVGKTDFVMIHDGARPFINSDLVKKVLSAAEASGSAVCAIPSKQTLKSVSKNFFIKNTLKREFIWEAQTPQIFRKDLIVEAYRKAGRKSATDDAGLVERLGHKVKLVEGSQRNIKITTPEDLKLAKIFLKDANRNRVRHTQAC